MLRLCWEEDWAQKQVTIMTEEWAESMDGTMLERIWWPVPRLKWVMFDDVRYLLGWLASSEDLCLLESWDFVSSSCRKKLSMNSWSRFEMPSSGRVVGVDISYMAF